MRHIMISVFLKLFTKSDQFDLIKETNPKHRPFGFITP